MRATISDGSPSCSSVLALLVAACRACRDVSAPSGSAAVGIAPSRRPGGVDRARRRHPPSARHGSQAEPGDVVIRWYCCLGTGDAPEQVEVELKVAEDFNASHPGIHLQFEGFVYAGARDALSTQLGVRQRPRHRRSGGHRRRRGVPRPVARPAAAHRQDRLRHEPVPGVDGRPVQRRRRRPARHPVRDLSVGPVLQGRHVQGGRSRRAAARVEQRSTRCPTARSGRGTTTPSGRSPRS